MRRTFFSILLITIVSVGVFFNTLENGFHLDDFYRVKDNPGIQNLSSPWRHFIDPRTMTTIPRLAQYRPLLPLSLSVNYRVHAQRLPGYHLVNLVIHIICAVFVYLLLLELLVFWGKPSLSPKPARNLALLSALFFAVHPVSGILVNYICARDLLLMQAFLLGSFLAYVRLRRLGATPLRWALTLGLFVLSMLSKTNGVAFPLVIIAFEMIFSSKKLHDHRLWARALPFLLVVFGYFGLTSFVLGFSDFDNVAAGSTYSSLTYALTQFKVHLTHYLYNFFWPWAIRPSPLVVPAQSIFTPAVLAGLILVLASLFAAWKLRKRDPLISFCVLAYWILLAPTSSLLPFHHLAVHYRPYPASPFFFMVLALLLAGGLPKKWLGTAAMVLLIYFASAALSLNTVWKTEESLWTHNVKHGGDALAHLNLAMSIKDRKDPRARAHLQKAVEMNPNYVLANMNLGLLLIHLGESKKGLALCRRAVELQPGRAQNHYWLGRAYNSLGRKAEAYAAGQKAAEIDPRNVSYQYQAGRSASHLKEYKKSLVFFDAVQKIRPGYKDNGFLRGFALSMIGRNDAAIESYRRFLAGRPKHFQAQFNVAYALMKKGAYDEAIAHFERTLALAPKYNEVHYHLATCFEKTGQPEQAERHRKLYGAY
jgi:protein O-mannosyl-transferase